MFERYGCQKTVSQRVSSLLRTIKRLLLLVIAVIFFPGAIYCKVVAQECISDYWPEMLIVWSLRWVGLGILCPFTTQYIISGVNPGYELSIPVILVGFALAVVLGPYIILAKNSDIFGGDSE